MLLVNNMAKINTIQEQEKIEEEDDADTDWLVAEVMIHGLGKILKEDKCFSPRFYHTLNHLHLQTAKMLYDKVSNEPMFLK